MPEAPPETNVAAASREAFAAWVNESTEGARTFGQVLIRSATPGYSLRHKDDAGATDLKVHKDPRAAREIAKLTEDGEHRPLKSSPNLRSGWEIQVLSERELAVAMSYLYPAGVVHWHLWRVGKLEVTNFRENAARQSGIYKRIQRLSDKGLQDAARACCEDAVCLKKTLWNVDEKTPLEMERGFSPSEREDLAALVEAAATGKVRFAREAEFEQPLNKRRMRYRKLTLVRKLGAQR